MWTIRVFCGCSSTPSCFRIRRAASTAARASAADLQVITGADIDPNKTPPHWQRLGDAQQLLGYRINQTTSVTKRASQCAEAERSGAWRDIYVVRFCHCLFRPLRPTCPLLAWAWAYSPAARACVSFRHVGRTCLD